MFPIAEDSDRGDASPKSGLPSSAAPMASDSTRCAELLKSGDYNVTEAATMTGFNDLGHFREVFKKEFGVTPSDYIKA
jgi:methylphosphotriester-DNA--protein-cysteine methyltransferase